ncbi:MAG: AMP phosphorylase [Nanoarchaeota archaeon]|nr:AMP phosphorylase [Nanoarchaeota archaeon]
MKVKVKDMDIATGGIKVIIVNEKDAAKLDLHHGDRVLIKKGVRKTTVIVDIGESSKAAPPGSVGVFEEVLDHLHAVHGDIVDILLENKPESVNLIRKKLDGGKLTAKELNMIVQDIVDDKLTDIEATYFVSACYSKGMSMEETKNLTLAMVNSGDVLKIDGKKKIFDKHCIGGVAGNRTTMLLVPICAAAGMILPKTSSRSITSPAGTADTMEFLTNVCLSLDQMKKVVKKTNACIVWGGALNLAPADDKIIHIENPLSVDAEGQLLASIMAKKKSVSSTHVLIDIPIGKGAKIENKHGAIKLKADFEKIGKALNMHVKVILTDGSQPIGNGIGPSLEARDILLVLKNDPKAPKDLREKSLMMSGVLLEMAGKTKKGKGYALAKEILDSGKAYKKMVDIIIAQGGQEVDISKIKKAKFRAQVWSKKSGTIKYIDNKTISKVARIAGAPKDKYAGIYLYKHVGDKIRKNEKLLTIHSENRQKLDYAKEMFRVYDGIIVK